MSRSEYWLKFQVFFSAKSIVWLKAYEPLLWYLYLWCFCSVFEAQKRHQFPFIAAAWKRAANTFKKKCFTLLSFTEERRSYEFGKPWGWVNDDRKCISGWNISFKLYTVCWDLTQSLQGDTLELVQASWQLTWFSACVREAPQWAFRASAVFNATLPHGKTAWAEPAS